MFLVSTKLGQVKTGQALSGLPSQAQSPRFSVLPITWLSGLSPMLKRAPRTIIDISQHASSVVYASWPSAVNLSQATSTSYPGQKKSLKIYIINPASVEYLDWCNRKELASLWAIKLAAQQPVLQALCDQNNFCLKQESLNISKALQSLKFGWSESCIIATVQVRHSQKPSE